MKNNLNQQVKNTTRGSGLSTTQMIALGIGIIVAGLLVWQLSRSLSKVPDAVAIQGVQTFFSLKRDHVAGSLRYGQSPPVGGTHSPVWQNCGIYDIQIPLENAVHSLEHGAVWVAYQPNLAEAEVKKLRDLMRGKAYTLLAPYQYNVLDKPVVAVAWGLRLELDRADDPRLVQFVTKYANGPQTPEPGAPCTGGMGAPNG